MSQYACNVIDFLLRGSIICLYIYLAVRGLKSVFKWIKNKTYNFTNFNIAGYTIILIDGSKLKNLHNNHKPF